MINKITIKKGLEDFGATKYIVWRVEAKKGEE